MNNNHFRPFLLIHKQSLKDTLCKDANMQRVTNVLLQLHIQYVRMRHSQGQYSRQQQDEDGFYLHCKSNTTIKNEFSFCLANPKKKAVIVCVFFQISSNARLGQNKAHSILKE